MGNILVAQNKEDDKLTDVIEEPTNEFGQNALMIAINNKDEIRIKNLLNNAKYLNEKDKYGWTPIIYSIHTADISIIKLILEKNPNMSILTDDKLSPLQHAKITRNQEIIELFLSNK
jgi:ankyrin repeat protein